jgi:hypothetical protein
MPDQDDLYRAFAGDDADLEGYTDPNLPLVALETLLNRPPSLRKRLLHSGLLLLALGVALIIFWGSIVPGKGVLLATVPPAPATLLISSNVSAGTVTINGRLQRGSLPLRVPLPTHLPASVVLAAPPFRPITCQLPPTRRPAPGTFAPCLVSSGGTVTAPEVDLRFYLIQSDLPLAQQGQIDTVLAQALSFQQETVVPPQDYFATNAAPSQMITSQRATTPLRASVFLVANTAAAPGSCGKDTCQSCGKNPCAAARFGVAALPGIPTDPPEPCVDFSCPNCVEGFCYQEVFGATSLSGQHWEVEVLVRLGWHFQQPAGKVVSTVIYPEIETLRLVLYADRWGNWQLLSQGNQGWNPAQQLSSVVTLTGRSLVALQLAGTGWSFSIAHQGGITGCEFAVWQYRQAKGKFLWRFGVLLAADAGAQTLWPTLPVAPFDEMAAVGG